MACSMYDPYLLSYKGTFTVWEETPEIKTTSRGHQRQIFLFKECIVLCKLKKDTTMNQDTYTFKNKMKVSYCLYVFAFFIIYPSLHSKFF